MKLLKLSAAALILIAGSASAQNIAGSAHDFSASGWNSTGEICVTCHTPHDSDTTVADAALWNHEVTDSSFTVYDTTTFDGDSTITQPGGVSKLCLSCHDGTVALDNFGGTTGGTNFVSTANNKGIDLGDDHPISFTYDATLVTADGGLHPITATSGVTDGTTIEADMLFAGKVECSSCHDVHNAYNQTALLVKSNAASELCLTCHNK